MPDFANPLKEKLAAGDPGLGTWIWSTDPCSAEMMAQAGFDWLMIDVEHSYIGPESLRNIIMAVDRYDSAPIARTKVGDIDSIKLSLDSGAMGVIIPQINTSPAHRPECRATPPSAPPARSSRRRTG